MFSDGICTSKTMNTKKQMYTSVQDWCKFGTRNTRCKTPRLRKFTRMNVFSAHWGDVSPSIVIIRTSHIILTSPLEDKVLVFSPKSRSLQCLYSAFSAVFDSILPRIFSSLDSVLPSVSHQFVIPRRRRADSLSE